MNREVMLWFIIAILSILLILCMIYGCCSVVNEGFQVGKYATAPSKTTSTPQPPETPSAPPPETPSAPPPESEEPNSEMNKTEQELFEQITNNKMSSDDLEKLIKAGIVSNEMIEKFLKRIDNGETVEPFCSGENSGCALE